MRSLIGSLALAFAMYSRIPAPKAAWTPAHMRYALGFFPLVGFVVGGALWIWQTLARLVGLEDALIAAVAVALPILLTGGIHLDGLCDTADALGSHAPRIRKLDILKDSHIGAFALIACGLYLLLDYGLWQQYRHTPRHAALILCGCILSRALSGLSVLCLPRAKADGYAATFADAAGRRGSIGLLCFWLTLSAGGMLVLAPALGGLCLLMVGAFFLHYRAMALRMFGGVTGDLAGWFLQLCEGLLLLSVSIGGSYL